MTETNIWEKRFNNLINSINNSRQDYYFTYICNNDKCSNVEFNNSIYDCGGWDRCEYSDLVYCKDCKDKFGVDDEGYGYLCNKCNEDLKKWYILKNIKFSSRVYFTF